jgi:hypothetical protein
MDLDERFNAAIAAMDAANALDPTGQALPYAQRMTAWLGRLAPDASDILRLAARGQHLRRWMIPRQNYPMTRAGYHRWRNELADFHAESVGAILRDAGYDPSSIVQVQSLLKKERLKEDPQTQTLEDVACLVFLQSYLPEFARKHPDEKVITILGRTWAKMSPAGQAMALKLPLAPEERRLLSLALAAKRPDHGE